MYIKAKSIAVYGEVYGLYLAMVLLSGLCALMYMWVKFAAPRFLPRDAGKSNWC
jgi:uncharacterized membrane protein